MGSYQAGFYLASCRLNKNSATKQARWRFPPTVPGSGHRDVQGRVGGERFRRGMGGAGRGGGGQVHSLYLGCARTAPAHLSVLKCSIVDRNYEIRAKTARMRTAPGRRSNVDVIPGKTTNLEAVSRTSKAPLPLVALRRVPGSSNVPAERKRTVILVWACCTALQGPTCE